MLEMFSAVVVSLYVVLLVAYVAAFCAFVGCCGSTLVKGLAGRRIHPQSR